MHEASNLHGVAEAHEHDEEGGSWCEPTPTANTAMAMAITTRMGTCSVRTEPMTRLLYYTINQSIVYCWPQLQNIELDTGCEAARILTGY